MSVKNAVSFSCADTYEQTSQKLHVAVYKRDHYHSCVKERDKKQSTRLNQSQVDR